MKLFVTTILSVCLTISVFSPLFALAMPANRLQTPDAILGIWSGDLHISSGKLTLVIHVSIAKDGKLMGSLDSPDQGAMGIPATLISFANGVLKFELSSLHATYEGKLSADGKTIEGIFTQGTEMPLTLKKVD